jgi:hypothetical protein
MKNSRYLKTKYNEFIFEKYNPKKYKSFSKLTKQDLFDIAKADPLGELEFSGVWDEIEEGDTETACRMISDSFENFLEIPFPDGFKNIPKIVPIYRFITLKDESKLNRNELGQSWFANPKLDIGFFDKLDYLIREDRGKPKNHKLFLISATTPETNIDIPRTLWLRDLTWAENEIHVKEDNDKIIHILSIEDGKKITFK